MKIEKYIKTNKTLPLSLKTIINLLVVAGKIKRDINDMMKSYGISEPQFNVLRILRGKEGKPANLKAIQERMIHKTSNTTRLVDRLIDKGFAERTTPKDNRRVVEISITKKGMDLLYDIDPPFDKFYEEILQKLTPKEIAELNLLLEKLNN